MQSTAIKFGSIVRGLIDTESLNFGSEVILDKMFAFSARSATVRLSISVSKSSFHPFDFENFATRILSFSVKLMSMYAFIYRSGGIQ